MSNYASADTKAQNFAGAYPGSKMNLSATTTVVCIHTTESLGWPGYSGGKSAPNYTSKPAFAREGLDFRAHFPDEMSSRALQNDAGGVETNKLNVIQIELVGTCDPKHKVSWNGDGKNLAGRDYIYWSEAPDWALRDVGAFLADMHRRHGLQLVAPEVFLPYPKSYGQSNSNRMTFDEWRKFVGVCGHQHIPENDHGDPGDINIARILEHARADVGEEPSAPAPAPQPPAPTLAPATPPVLRQGAQGDWVRTIQRLLNITADGDFGPKTLAAVKSFQSSRGLLTDGIVGPKTWQALETPWPVHPAPAPAPAYKPRPVLRIGARSAYVRTLQRALGLRVDGIFGTKTLAAVKAFQKRHGLVADGVVGPRTWAALG